MTKRRAIITKGTNAPVQRSGWQSEFHEAIITFLVEHGSLVREGDTRHSYGGWQDYTVYEDYDFNKPSGTLKHMRGCQIDFARSAYDDSEWDEFDGTFAEPPWRDCHGIDAIVFCRCGQIAGRRWRYEGTHAELLRSITS